MKKERIMGILDPITVFHKNRGSRSEITELPYHSFWQGHTYIYIKSNQT